MEFTLPTTKTEMYETLDMLYKHYRASSPLFKQEDLKSLTLTPIEYEAKSLEDCAVEARLLLSAKHLEEITEKKAEISNEIYALNIALSGYAEEERKEIVDVEETYAKLIKESEIVATEKGVSMSCIALGGRGELVGERRAEIAKIKQKYREKTSATQTQITALTQKLSAVEEYFLPIHEQEIAVKAQELLIDNQKQCAENFKYNNSVYEKNVKYENVLVQAKANLELKFMEVRKDYTTAELIEMGYYTDVLACVFGYYDTLPANEAYMDITGEQNLILYLDSYHTTVVNLLKSRATPIK